MGPRGYPCPLTSMTQTQKRRALWWYHIGWLWWEVGRCICETGQSLSLFMDSDSVSGKVGVKSTREETGGLHPFRFSQGWGSSRTLGDRVSCHSCLVLLREWPWLEFLLLCITSLALLKGNVIWWCDKTTANMVMPHESKVSAILVFLQVRVQSAL